MHYYFMHFKFEMNLQKYVTIFKLVTLNIEDVTLFRQSDGHNQFLSKEEPACTKGPIKR